MSATENDLKKKTGEVFALVRREIERFADGLSVEEKNRAGSLQDWSAQFTLVHLAFWENHYAAVFEKGLAGEAVPLSGSYLDQLNDGVLYEHKDQPFEAARADEAAAYHQFLEFFERGVSPQALADSTPLPYLKNFTLLNRMLRSYALHPVHHLSDYYVKNGRAERAEELQESLSQAVAQAAHVARGSILQAGRFLCINGLGAARAGRIGQSGGREPQATQPSTRGQ